MICIQLSGGLGNQMFQYACGRSLAYKHQTDLVFDVSRLNKQRITRGITIRSFELDIFKINASEVSKKDLKKLKPFIYRIVNTFNIKIGLKGIQTLKYFIENKYSYNAGIEQTTIDCFLSGYWQSPRYFQAIDTMLRDEFKFPTALNNVNHEWMDAILNTNSVGLHIRRTDFVNNISHDIHGICSMEYYKSAIEFISDKIKDPFFFIFSDDIEWAKENLKLTYPCSFISGNKGNKSYIDMQLMSACKHNIIANSSFSWWGAWLNNYQDKIIIAPNSWFTDETMNSQIMDLIPKEWIRM